jgi:hypothetical protein
MIGEGLVSVKNEYRNQLLLHVADKFDIHFWWSITDLINVAGGTSPCPTNASAGDREYPPTYAGEPWNDLFALTRV